ncbi:hypothetical protein PspTeo4_10600 [Pseudomonas sp. Teo4]|nr:hypothetical protein [Pseudomonas sp. Teo4]
MMRKVLLYSMPTAVIGLLLILWMAHRLTKPLRQLAQSATQLSANETSEQLHRIDAWYTEAAAISRALLTGGQLLQDKFRTLRDQAQNDALTGLPNRRALQLALDTLMISGEMFAVLALDIDHFKRVNDTYGHDAGDDVLKHLADLLRHSSRQQDLPCRVGGEEFIMLLPGTGVADARRIAERIREAVELSRPTRLMSAGLHCPSAWPVGRRTPNRPKPCSSRQMSSCTGPSRMAATEWKCWASTPHAQHPRSTMKSITACNPSPFFRLLNVHGRCGRMRWVSRSITSSEAPT